MDVFTRTNRYEEVEITPSCTLWFAQVLWEIDVKYLQRDMKAKAVLTHLQQHFQGILSSSSIVKFKAALKTNAVLSVV